MFFRTLLAFFLCLSSAHAEDRHLTPEDGETFQYFREIAKQEMHHKDIQDLSRFLLNQFPARDEETGAVHVSSGAVRQTIELFNVMDGSNLLALCDSESEAISAAFEHITYNGDPALDLSKVLKILRLSKNQTLIEDVLRTIPNIPYPGIRRAMLVSFLAHKDERFVKAALAVVKNTESEMLEKDKYAAILEKMVEETMDRRRNHPKIQSLLLQIADISHKNADFKKPDFFRNFALDPTNAPSVRAQSLAYYLDRRPEEEEIRTAINSILSEPRDRNVLRAMIPVMPDIPYQGKERADLISFLAPGDEASLEAALMVAQKTEKAMPDLLAYQEEVAREVEHLMERRRSHPKLQRLLLQLLDYPKTNVQILQLRPFFRSLVLDKTNDKEVRRLAFRQYLDTNPPKEEANQIVKRLRWKSNPLGDACERLFGHFYPPEPPNPLMP